MAEDVRIRLLLDGEEVVATITGVDEGLDDIVSSATRAEGGLDDVGETGKQAMAKVERSGRRASDALDDVDGGTVQVARSGALATQVLGSLGDGLQDLSFANNAGDALRFAGNNAAFAAEGFGQVVNKTGSVTGGFKAIGSSILGVGGILLAFQALVAFGPKLIDMLGRIGGKAIDTSVDLDEYKEALEGLVQFQPAGDDAAALDAQIQQTEALLRRVRDEAERLNDEDSNRVGRFVTRLQAGFGDFLTSDPQKRDFLASDRIGLEKQAEADRLEALAQERERLGVLQDITQERLTQLRARREALDLTEQFDVPTSSDDAEPPPRPPVPLVEPEDALIEQDAVNFDAELQLGALAEMELRLQTIDRLQRGGIFADLEADRERLRAAQTALRRLQEEAAQGGDVEADTVRRLRDEIERLEARIERLRGDAAEKTREGVSSGISSGAQIGASVFQAAMSQGITAITQDMEDSFAQAIMQAVLRALASAAVQELTSILASGGSSEGGGSGGTLSSIITVVATVAGIIGGFSRGGHTGMAPRDRVAGFVHGQEFVMNADATAGNERGLYGLQGMLERGVSMDDVFRGVLGLSSLEVGGMAAIAAPPRLPRPSPASTGADPESALIDEVRRLREDVRGLSSRPIDFRVGSQDKRRIVDDGRERRTRKNPRG